MCHTRIRAKNTTDKTFECHTMTDNKKNSVLIAVQYLAFYEIRHSLLYIILLRQADGKTDSHG